MADHHLTGVQSANMPLVRCPWHQTEKGAHPPLAPPCGPVETTDGVTEYAVSLEDLLLWLSTAVGWFVENQAAGEIDWLRRQSGNGGST